MKSKYAVPVILLTLAVGWLGSCYFAMPTTRPTGTATMMGGPTPVAILTVHAEELMPWQDFSGRLVATDRVDIRPRVGGAITEVYFQPGTEVKKDAPLFLIDPRPYRAAVNQAAAAVSAAENQSRLAQSQFARATRLIQEKAIAQREYDERTNTKNVAVSNVAAAKAALEQAQLNLNYATVKAPISGQISRAEITVGNMVDGGQNAPVLASIVSSNPIYADFEIDEKTYLENAKDFRASGETIPVNLTLSDSADITYEGKVLAFDNAVNTHSGTIRVRAIFDNPEGMLVDGLFARVRLGSPKKIPLILVPENIISTDQTKRFVYVVDKDGKAEYRELTLGELIQGKRRVLSGLKDGEKIIADSLQRIRPGAPVVAKEPAAAPAKAGAK